MTEACLLLSLLFGNTHSRPNHHKLSNSSWKVLRLWHTNSTLKFRYAQYIGNYQNIIIWPNPHSNPICTLYTNNTIDTWSHLFSPCSNKHIKRIVHNTTINVVHQIAHSNPRSTRDFIPSLMHETQILDLKT